MSNVPEEEQVEVVDVQAVTPHNRALYEAGKKLLVESVETGREFCKTMITVATGAIPVFVALVGIVTPKDHVMTLTEGTRGVSAGILFMLSAIGFVIGYLPKSDSLSLDTPASIEAARVSLVRRRLTWGWIGFILFLAGVAVAAYTALSMIGTTA